MTLPVSKEAVSVFKEEMRTLADRIKTEESDRRVTQNFAETHVLIGIKALRLILGQRKTVRHLKYDW